MNSAVAGSRTTNALLAQAGIFMRDHHRKHEMTQVAIGNFLGVSNGMISCFELGKCWLQPPQILAFGNIADYGTPVFWKKVHTTACHMWTSVSPSPKMIQFGPTVKAYRNTHNMDMPDFICFIMHGIPKTYTYIQLYQNMRNWESRKNIPINETLVDSVYKIMNENPAPRKKKRKNYMMNRNLKNIGINAQTEEAKRRAELLYQFRLDNNLSRAQFLKQYLSEYTASNFSIGSWESGRVPANRKTRQYVDKLIGLKASSSKPVEKVVEDDVIVLKIPKNPDIDTMELYFKNMQVLHMKMAECCTQLKQMQAEIVEREDRLKKFASELASS